MGGQDLAFAGIARQARLIRDGQVSSRELVETCLRRIEELGPRLNAFTEVLGDRALSEAESADRGGDAEEQPLRGVPIAIKDYADVAGAATWHGTRAFDGEPATADGELVRRLRAAGAVIIAKTTLPELAILPFTETRGWGATRNPWDTDRGVGGSSGGSAAAVAAGLVGAATASDGGGSIRIPSAFCGLFGLKPQWGRVPMEPPGHWHGLSAAGCVSRTVADTALFLDVVTAEGGDPGGPPPPDRPFAQAAASTPGRLRIAISRRPARAILPPVLSDEVEAGLEATEDLLRSLGHDVRRHEPDFGLAGANFIPRYIDGIGEDVGAVPHPERLEPRTRGFGRLAAAYPAAVVRRAVRAGVTDGERINRSWSGFDLLITPAAGEVAPEIGRWRQGGALRTLLSISRVFAYTPVWNHTGQPAAAMPAGFTAGGLPRSVTVVAKPGDETTLISLAAQVEAESGWTARRPPVS